MILRARHRRRHQEAFTLVELTVALAAGLIVALGIVGLSKDATRTFHEEMRSSAAEANLRTAIDRLRADLGRAGFMSTSNIASDPAITKPPSGGVALPKTWGLAKLASIQLIPGGSAADTPLSAKNGPLTPDAVWIGGDMTTSDLYSASLTPAAGGAAGGAGCMRLFLDPTAPAMARLLANSTQPAKELNNVFQPTPGGQFIIRVLDKIGHTEYLATCPGTPAGIDGQPYVDVDANTPFLGGQATQTVSVVSGTGLSQMWVNPVQIVQYKIIPASTEAAQYTASPLGGLPLSPGVADDTKYDLVRSYIDAISGTEVLGSQEIIAEYAVDLAFAFSVETGTSLQPALATLPFDSVDNQLWAQDVANQPLPAVKSPQRIRSVRVRLVTRAAQPDRILNIPVPAADTPAGTFLYRYCVLAGGCDAINTKGVLQYARARTVTAEVSLPNQSGNFFQ